MGSFCTSAKTHIPRSSSLGCATPTVAGHVHPAALLEASQEGPGPAGPLPSITKIRAAYCHRTATIDTAASVAAINSKGKNNSFKCEPEILRWKIHIFGYSRSIALSTAHPPPRSHTSEESGHSNQAAATCKEIAAMQAWLQSIESGPFFRSPRDAARKMVLQKNDKYQIYQEADSANKFSKQ